jgi:hypothetical protein
MKSSGFKFRHPPATFEGSVPSDSHHPHNLNWPDPLTCNFVLVATTTIGIRHPRDEVERNQALR